MANVATLSANPVRPNTFAPIPLSWGMWSDCQLVIGLDLVLTCTVKAEHVDREDRLASGHFCADESSTSVISPVAIGFAFFVLTRTPPNILE